MEWLVSQTVQSTSMYRQFQNINAKSSPETAVWIFQADGEFIGHSSFDTRMLAFKDPWIFFNYAAIIFNGLFKFAWIVEIRQRLAMNYVTIENYYRKKNNSYRGCLIAQRTYVS